MTEEGEKKDSEFSVRINREWTFQASHQLEGHRGKCANVHGHAYRVSVELEGPLITEEQDVSSVGMIMDFADLDQIMSRLFITKMDHAFIAKGNEKILESLETVLGLKVYVLGERTTTENIALHIWGRLHHELVSLNFRGSLVRVRVYETNRAYAEIHC